MHIDRLHDLSLKWKLLIPFLFLAAMGAMALFLVSYRFQAHLIRLNEAKRLTGKYHYFLDTLDLRKDQVLSLASLVAEDPSVSRALAEKDRQGLMDVVKARFETLRRDYNIAQLHFHTPSGKSFLRVHRPSLYGDALRALRQTVNVAASTGRKAAGLEKGTTGFSLRGVVPVRYQGTQVGTVEVGMALDQRFLERFKEGLDADVTLYVPGEPLDTGPKVFASTSKIHRLSLGIFNQVLCGEEPFFYTTTEGGAARAVIAGPVHSFSPKIVAVVEISVDRSATLALLKQYKATAAGIGLAGLVLSISFVWLLSAAFTRRIAKVVEASEDIAAGNRDTRIEIKGGDEIGIMAESINKMLAALDQSRLKIKAYAENLESMVEERTRALRESEQSYKTLVEHVPVIVYFVMADGTAMFLNRFVEEVLGVIPQEISGHHEVWAEHIHPHDRARVETEFETCLREGKEFHLEYRMIHKDGHIVHVLDHAVPVFENNSRLSRMDGIIVDITARKELQDKIVQADEMETLSEVSARLAHEIRNPLTSIGGLTRRLVKSFGPSDPRRKKGQMIVEEVGRLEKILSMMVAYIEPKSITLRQCELNDLVTRAVRRIESKHKDQGLTVECRLDEALQPLQLDCDLFEKVLLGLMENAFFRMGQQGRIEITTRQNGRYATLIMSYELAFVSEDDIDHYFYPFVVDYPFSETRQNRTVLDIPICKVLVHKHGGIINVNKEGDNTVKITISLPYKPPESL